MKLTRISVRRMPGIVDSFTIDGVGPGLNVIVGPNGIGKSSTMTALRALLWPEREQPSIIDVDATWIHDGHPLRSAQHTPGQTTWQRDGQPIAAPPLPEERFAKCFFPTLHDLLSPSDDDTDLGKEIATQLAGGYDVSALLGSGRFEKLGRPGQKEAGELKEAIQVVAQLHRSQGELAKQEQQLEGERRRLADARSARSRLEVLGRAKHRLDARDTMQAADEVVAGFPAGMEKLHGDERPRLGKLHQEAERADADAVKAQAEEAIAEQGRARSGLDAPVDAALLATARADAESVRTQEHKLDDLVRRLRAAEEERQLARDRLGSSATVPRTDALSLRAIEQLVHADVELAAARARHDAELSAVGDAGPTDDGALRDGAAALRAWLAAPDPVRPGQRVRFVALALAAILLIVAIALAGFVHFAWGALDLVAVALVVAALLLDRGAHNTRPGEVQRYPAARLPPPASWTRPIVESRLAELDTQLASTAGARVRADRRATLEAFARTLGDRTDTHAAELAHARDTLGIAVGGALTLASLADALRQLWAADTEAAGIEGERTATELQHGEGVRRVSAVVTPFGYIVQRAEEAVAAVAALASRSQDFLRFSHERDDARRRVEKAHDLAIARRKEAADLLVGAGASDEADLASRLDRHKEWREAIRNRDAADGAAKEHERTLGSHAEILLLDPPALSLATEQAERDAAQADPLADSIASTENKVNTARNGRELEKALDERTARKQALTECRDKALTTIAGRFLLESVARRHAAESRPVVLQRAMDDFATFTHREWKLTVDRDGDLRAVSTATGEGRSLDQLSDGTRAQLLLAVRLAFAAQAEKGGARMPFVLDEALSVSDPARFDAVVESLVALVKSDDRQVFYLTSQPVDAERWRRYAGNADDALHLIDLGAIRRAQAAAPETTLRIPVATEIPAPGADDDAASYAARVGVPRLALLGGADAQHPFYLLDDDIPALHALLRLRVSTVGALKELLTSQAARTLDQELRTRMTERVRWFCAFAEAWGEGRGRPVGRQDMIDARVSANFIEPVTALAAQLGGDGGALVVAMRAGQIPRMRTKAIADLENWLSRSGSLDSRPTLTEDQVRNQVLAAATAPERDASVIPGCVAKWMMWSVPSVAAAGTPPL